MLEIRVTRGGRKVHKGDIYNGKAILEMRAKIDRIKDDRQISALMREIGNAYVLRFMENLMDMTYMNPPPGYRHWEPLSESRQRERERHGLNPKDPMLIAESKRILNSHRVLAVGKGKAVIVNECPYSRFHITGATKGNWVLPKRDWMWVPEQTKQKVMDMIMDWVDGKSISFARIRGLTLRG